MNKKRAKQLFWFCYGEYAVENLKNNTKYKEPKVIQCIDCGEWFEVDKDSKLIRCEECKILHRKRQKLETWNKNKEKYRTC